MTVYSGGRRQRLISDSVYHLIKNCLEDLGWFSLTRKHAPITVRTTSVEIQEEIAFNTIVINQTGTIDEDAELGSNLGEMTTTYFVDFYAEKDALGKELIFDVRDILRGRMPAIGRTSQTIPVYDWGQATPTLLFTCDIEDVVVDKARDFPKPWQQYWWSCRFDLVDSYD